MRVVFGAVVICGDCGGRGETKATGLWLRGLPPLTPTNIVAERVQRVHRMAPGPDRWRERSRTYPGLAAAMAEQWGAALDLGLSAWPSPKQEAAR